MTLARAEAVKNSKNAAGLISSIISYDKTVKTEKLHINR